jgi:UDP-3-O-[3-hydroxymyristoyl] glucosamine N-acyltransferase
VRFTVDHERKDSPVATTVRQLAELVGGTVVGDGALLVKSARILHEAEADDITFLDSAPQALKLQASRASAAVVPTGLVPAGKTVIQVADPIMAFVMIVQHFQGKVETPPAGINARASVDPTATISTDPDVAAGVQIGAGSIIGARCRLHFNVVIGKNCKIGDDVVLHPNVVLYDDCVLGDRVIIHANSVIGADGFGYRFQKGRHVKVPQLGNVVIGNDVEIGACSCVDRGAFGATVIGEGTKIDNLVQIAHNVKIGKHNALAAQVGIAGSSNTGNFVFMGGQAGVSDHINVGEGTMMGAKTGLFRSVGPGKRLFMYPAHEERDAGRIMACLKKLPTMRKDLLRVLKELNLNEADAPAVNVPEAPAA